MRTDHLQAIVRELVTKPGHEKIREHLLRLLTDGLGADAASIDFGRQVPEVRGRIDALLGRTLFEIKRDLVRERTDAEAQLARYLPQREVETGQRFVGIATDGAEFRVYMMRDGRLDELGQFKPNLRYSRGLLGWLESVIALNDEIPPDVVGIQRELGRHSIAYHRAIREIEALWQDLEDHPDANLKRDLWNRLLRVAYGADVEAPPLLFQHTYLTIVAKGDSDSGARRHPACEGRGTSRRQAVSRSRHRRRDRERLLRLGAASPQTRRSAHRDRPPGERVSPAGHPGRHPEGAL